MRLVLGFPRTDNWVTVDDDDLEEEEQLRNKASNLAPEKVVDMAIVSVRTLTLP